MNDDVYEEIAQPEDRISDLEGEVRSLEEDNRNLQQECDRLNEVISDAMRMLERG